MADQTNTHRSDESAMEPAGTAPAGHGETAENPASQASEAGGEPSAEQKITQLEKALADMKDQWLRAIADNDNIRKRAERDQAEISKYAITNLAREVIAVSENLHRALEMMTPQMLADAQSPAVETLHAGVEMTRSELLRILERHGITRIHPQRGDAFDHNYHQAISQIEDGGVKDGTISQVIQAGYRIHERLLQPAMVAVAKSAQEAKPKLDTTA